MGGSPSRCWEMHDILLLTLEGVGQGREGGRRKTFVTDYWIIKNIHTFLIFPIVSIQYQIIFIHNGHRQVHRLFSSSGVPATLISPA